MLIVFFSQGDLFAFGVVSILLLELALLNEMFLNLLDFNDLLALPACGKHGTVSPVMHIKTLITPIWIMGATKVTYLI
jgi:hypothetical protein